MSSFWVKIYLTWHSLSLNMFLCNISFINCLLNGLLIHLSRLYLHLLQSLAQVGTSYSLSINLISKLILQWKNIWVYATMMIHCVVAPWQRGFFVNGMYVKVMNENYLSPSQAGRFLANFLWETCANMLI